MSAWDKSPMSVSPEERATVVQAALVEASRVPARQVSWLWDDSVAEIITGAIREACNEKLEEAVREVRLVAVEDERLWPLRQRISALKLKDPTP